MKYFPDDYKKNDLIFPGNDKIDEYQYNLVDAKVLTKERITLYIKKQGINLEVDDCCANDDVTTYDKFDAWNKIPSVQQESDLQEILSNSKYKSTGNILTYKFPVSRIETQYYEVYHNLWIFDKDKATKTCQIFFNDDETDPTPLTVDIPGGKKFLTLKLTYESTDDSNFINKISTDTGNEKSLDTGYSISKINFRFQGVTDYSPAIALHWTYYKVNLTEPDPKKRPNFTLKGTGICSYTNPCVKGYACSRGICEKCHASCFDCLNGGLSTDCLSQCSPISSAMLPDRGSCPLGYVDLVQFEDFKITDAIPPFRNRRLTVSFWFFITSIPDEDADADIFVSYDPEHYITFEFRKTFFNIKYYKLGPFTTSDVDTWFFVKVGVSAHHGGKFMFVKYFNGEKFKYFFDGYEGEGNDNGAGAIPYEETIDFEYITFENFTNLVNSKIEFKFFIKELILFREYLRDPYDNKYFSYEKIFTSTFELPEVLFIIPFDELIKNDDKYDIKCYSYAGSILEYKTTLTPYYNSDKSNLYSPKSFRPLNLLGRNEKFISPDLVNIGEVLRDNNTLLASYDYIPISCVDNYFITYKELTISEESTSIYEGACNLNCEKGHSMLYGLSENKGFCNKLCGDGDSSPICLSNNYDLLHLKEKFQCKSGYYGIFNHCDKYDDEEKFRTIRYDANQGPANIVLNVIEYDLKSYIIDFWMNCGFCPDIGNTIFRTNQFYITSENIFFSFENRRTSQLIIPGGWNHYSIEVFYDPKEAYNKKSKMYVQKNFLPAETHLVEYSENPIPLEYIYFCNGRKSSCNNIHMSWNCANYKNLRLFNGNLAQRHILYRYDEYYADYKYLLSSIKFYYPLYGHYIADNLWSQYNSQDSALNTNSPTNNWNYPQYAYEKVTATCNYCNSWSNIETPPFCFECRKGDNSYLFRENNNIECRTDSNYYYVLRLPTNSDFKLIPLTGLKYPAVTISFFIKIYGFAIGGKIDVIYLGEKLKISYNSDLNSDSFGLNLITYKGDNEIVVSNYYHFRKHFGLWTFISVSVYDQTNENFFPPMVRFEINDKKIPIIGPLENLSVGDIYFSPYLFALVKSMTVYKTYLIGNLAFERNNKATINNPIKYPYYNIKDSLTPASSVYDSYFEKVRSKDECRFANFGIKATEKANSDNIVDTYDCVIDEIEEIFPTIDNIHKYYSFSSESSVILKYCNNERKDDICIGPTNQDYSCNYQNNNFQIFLGNVSSHYCKNFTYINFAKAEDIVIEGLPGGGKTFTLHFWVFAYSYLNKVFKGISVEWKDFVTIKVGLDSSGNYYFTCIIGDIETKKYLEFKMNEWNFLHCSVDYGDSKFYIASDNKSNSYGFTYTNEPEDNTITSLIIKDINTVDDWGILFYKHIRIWNTVLRYSSFLSRITIQEKYFGTGGLLNQWNTSINLEHKMISTLNDKNKIITYSNKKIGANIVNEKVYLDNIDLPKTCSEQGQYFDRKTKECVNFADMSNLKENIILNKIDVSYSHNYGMAFWILLEDHKSVEKSIDFIWQYHMKMSLIYDGSFKAFCFPQNYEPYSDILKDETISLEQRATNVLNSALNEYTDNLSGIWIWFQCFLSYYNRIFYLNENQQTLITETLYKEGNTEFKNDEPLGRFLNDVKGNELSTVELRVIKNKEKRKKVYIRSFYLFKDYLPYNYNFKYMDLSKITTNQFPPLTLVINSDSFKFEKDSHGNLLDNIKLNYNQYSSLDNILTPQTKTLTFENNEYELASNFVFLPLCNPVTKEKFNQETSLCEEITLCDETELNAIYCMEEKTPLICRKNFYINIDSDGSVTCQNLCQDPTKFRTPGSHETTGICGTDCLSVDILKTCPNSASSILTYENDFECTDGYYRIGYQCIPFPTNNLPNKGALFYSGLNHPYNIYQKIKTNVGKNYVLEFWFMIDNVLYTNFETGKNYHYFYFYPHQLYLKLIDGIIKYYYKFNSIEIEITPSDLIHKYEWNKILIFTEENDDEVNLTINFDKARTMHIHKNNLDNTLTYLAFCSEPRTSQVANGIYIKCTNEIKNWASAYYNNIRIWNSTVSTIDTIQSFINEIYTEYPQSLILFYPLTIQYLDNNQLTNIMSNADENIVVVLQGTTLYNKDNIIIYNYSTKFDWGILHKKQFVSNMNGLQIDPNDANNKCNEHCTRCFSTDDVTECYECEDGYILQYKECKDARKLYFLKTPSGTSGASIGFQTKNKDGKDFLQLTSFTLVFWMKFFGIKYTTTTENNRILSIDANTYVAYQRSSTDLIMMENSKVMFRDINFHDYFGVWIPISIANYISNAINYVYPNMFTLSVNKIDIPFTDEYEKIPESGIKITELTFGSDIIALFAELSIYSKFIQGGYGRIRSLEVLKDQFFYKSLTGTKPNDCLVVQDDLNSDISLICAPDYSINFIDSYYCKNDEKYFYPYNEENDENPVDEQCIGCNEVCTTLCFGKTEQNCTCDMTDGIYWLRKDSETRQTYCERIYYLDFSNIEPYTFYNTPITKTKEYTIEFWVFVYSYSAQENFKELYIEWNYHNRFTLFYEDRSLKVKCQPIWRSHDFSTLIYSDERVNTIQYHAWEYVRCGTDLKNRKYFSNTNIEYDLKAKKDTFFDFDTIDSDSTPSSLKFFKIYRSENFLNNFGFVFIKEIKLWQQYNIDYLDTKNIYFDMEQITKEDIKKNFPGLLLYYQNNFNLTSTGNSVIREELTGRVSYLPKSPDYLGYNIIDDNLGSPEKFEYIHSCPYGHVYNTITYECTCARGFTENDGTCVPNEDEQDATCQVYSNINKQCLQCKENNQYLNRWPDEFPEVCYNDCPATLYEDPLINQCRRCHETCYECTNEFYNNCVSCTGVLYFNFKENTCIPNCQTAGLTRSLTKPNICVIFDAGAELVNVNEEIPVNVNEFDFIEAKVVQPTSSEYETYWLFEVEKTNEINKNLGLFDDIKEIDEHPFTGDRTKLNVTLDRTFFKTEHKYVFGLKIYAENKGLEVPVYVYWTLTMNSPPYGGRVTTMPSVGLFNTTTFVIRCVDYLDENTPQDELEYDFYYIEYNTNMKIKLSKDFSRNNEVYSNFTVRFYQLEYSNISIYCVVKDKWGATSQSESTIMIVNDKHSELYNLKQIVASFYLNDDEDYTDIQILARTEVLFSLGLNPYNDRIPSAFYTTYENTITGDKIIKIEPQCVNGYCNDNGNCEVIDIAVTCKCNPTHVGKQCFIDKNGYADLAEWYKKMYDRIMGQINNNNLVSIPLNDYLFSAIYKLFFAAQNFFQNETFFEENLIDFRSYLKQEFNYITQNTEKFDKIFDIDVFYLNYFYSFETQTKLTKKINEGYQFRNKTLTEEEVSLYKNYFEKFYRMIDEDTVFLIKYYQYDYYYTCQYFNYYLIEITQDFDDEEFFDSLKTVLVSYKPTILFMKCLKEKYESFSFYLNYIEYLVNPMSFDSKFYPNITSPYITLKIYDTEGKEISLDECSSIIKIRMPFNAYDWLNYINQQKWLFLPENYKLEDDPVFRDPILIREDGSVSDDTVEERIKNYYRYYNIVGLVYTPNQINLFEYTSVIFKNISDAFFLLFETTHLSGFSSMLIPNPMKFIIDGRFFYVPRYMVLLFLDNHLYNPVFYMDGGLFFAFVIIALVFYCKDFRYFEELETLDFLVKEVYKNNFGYDQIDPGINDGNIYKLIHHINKDLKLNNDKKIRGMFDQYEFDDIKEDEDENKSDKSNEIKNQLNNNLNITTGRKLMQLGDTYNYNNNKNNDDNSENDQKTEIKTNRKKNKRYNTYKSNRSNRSKSENKKSKKDNPPKKNKKENIMTTQNDSDISGDEDEKEENMPEKNEMNINIRNKRSSKVSFNNQEKISKISKPFSNKYNINNNNNFYAEDEIEDFDENKLEKVLSSEKSSNKPRFVGFSQVNQNYGFNSTKYSKNSKLSKQSKKSYFIDKDNTRPNQYISIEKFHNKSYKLNIDNNIMNYDEEKKKALDEYTKLNISTFEFFKYNLKTRHLLIGPFYNLTLYHNRWKKLISLLTQFFIEQLSLSILLTDDENILLNNFVKMLIASSISMVIGNVVIHIVIPFFSVSFYERKKIYRYAEHGENLYVYKIWSNLVRKMNIKVIFAILFITIIWIVNFYITLGFTAVWKVQRITFIMCFLLTIALDLVVGEVIIEGICAFFFSKRKKYNLVRNIGEIFNRYRNYRTLYP